ncbi:gpW family head-tail joining protein [Salinarimonas rosea]|uniref:gpW family head-tail joining protein n=1 Tax=Salinarimonas rosea TaxID=552063 RepID=UPI000428B2A3|nr:gpW family head-tail joining protein [Salinarimonas rosea]
MTVQEQIADLKAYRTSLETARRELMLGRAKAQVAYALGGNTTVVYARADLPALQQEIRRVDYELAVLEGRPRPGRPIHFA